VLEGKRPIAYFSFHSPARTGKEEDADGSNTSSSCVSKNPWSDPALLPPPRPESELFEFPPDSLFELPEFEGRLGELEVFPLPFPTDDTFLLSTVVQTECAESALSLVEFAPSELPGEPVRRFF